MFFYERKWLPITSYGLMAVFGVAELSENAEIFLREKTWKGGFTFFAGIAISELVYF